MARRVKEFEQYLIDGGDSHIHLEDYTVSPATAFLKYTVEAKSAVDLCSRHFPKKTNGNHSSASTDSLEHIVKAMLPALMGHFETYQRFLFAGIFDHSTLLGGFEVESFFKKLKKETDVQINLSRLAAHRGIGASSIGMLLADAMKGWHSPEKVNSYFDAFGVKTQFFSNDDCRRLNVLWQLRHSIAHTAGTLTLADAQKVAALSGLGDTNIVFENNFIFEVSRKLHPIVQAATERLGMELKGRVIPGAPKSEVNTFHRLFEVKSSIAVWLKN